MNKVNKFCYIVVIMLISFCPFAYGLEFDVPSWADSPGAVFSEWDSFSAGFGEPGNKPDVEGSDQGFIITQSMPGGMVTGSGNIYNPAMASVFRMSGEAERGYRKVHMQIKSMGALAQEEVVLRYEGEEGPVSLQADQMREVGRQEGGFGDTIIQSWSWDIAGQSPKTIEIGFKAVGPHMSLDAVRLNALYDIGTSWNPQILSPLLDRWNYPYNATPGLRAKASLFGAEENGVGVSRHGTFVVGFDTGDSASLDLPPDAYAIDSVKMRLLTSSNFEAFYDPSFDPVTVFLPEGHDERSEDEDAGHPVELFGAGFRNGFDMLTWHESTDYNQGEGTERSAFPAVMNEDGELNDVSLAVDFVQPTNVIPFAIGTLKATSPGDLVPEDTWMDFNLNLEDASTVAYLQQGLSVGRLIFTATSLARGGHGKRTFPEFHTSDSLLGESPQLLIEYRIIEAPVVAGILDISQIEGSVKIRVSASESQSLTIVWSQNLVDWNEVDEPVFEDAGDGDWHWIEPDPKASMRFYQVLLR